MIVTQEPDRTRIGLVALVAVATAVVVLVLVGIAWWLVEPGPMARAPAPSRLERSVFGEASRADLLRGDSERALGRTEWVDRSAHLVRVPIDRAIDAVVANPALIGAAPPPEAR